MPFEMDSGCAVIHRPRVGVVKRDRKSSHSFSPYAIRRTLQPAHAIFDFYFFIPDTTSKRVEGLTGIIGNTAKRVVITRTRQSSRFHEPRRVIRKVELNARRDAS